MSKIYPEIAEAVKEQQQLLENLATKLAKEPPASVKKEVLQRIGKTAQTNSAKGREVPFQPNKKHTPAASRWLAAASLFIVASLTFFLYQYSTNESQLVAAKIKADKARQTAVDSLKATLQDKANIEKALTQEEQLVQHLAMDNTRKVALKGTANSPSSNVEVFWNATTGAVAMHALELPPLTEGKQYQLWAIVEGTPTDMGVFSDKQDNKPQLMPYDVSEAAAFAITIEPEGGSKEPTLSSMVVMGTVS